MIEFPVDMVKFIEKNVGNLVKALNQTWLCSSKALQQGFILKACLYYKACQ